MSENEINSANSDVYVALQEIAKAATISVNQAVAALKALAEALEPTITSMFEVVEDLWENIQKASVPPKWWHYYKHAKKARTRKKYYNRIQQYITKALAEQRKESTNENAE